MKPGTGIAVVLLALVASPSYGDEDAEQIARLGYWQQTPLDLSRADPTEIALLPGMDPELAEAVAGLRELGELRFLKDLTRIPGIDAATVDGMRPYVRLGSGPVDLGARWRLVAQRRGVVDGARWRQDLRARSGPLVVDLVAVDSSREFRRGAASLEHAGIQLMAGFLVLADGPAGILRIAPSRSRLAPAPRPRSPAVRARTDSGAEPGWVGAAAAFGERGLLFAGSAPDGRRVGALAFRTDPGPLSFGAAARVSRGAAGISAFVMREERRFAAWGGFVAEGSGRSMVLAGRARGQGWQAGLDASSTDGSLTRGMDPVSGHRLDRTHRVMQMHGRVRGSGWSGGAIWRQLERGRLDEIRPASAVEFDLLWRPQARVGPDQVRLRLRAAPTMRVTVSARFPFGPNRFRVRFSRDGGAGGGSELVGVEYLCRTRRIELRLAAAAVEGAGSRVWMLSRPGTGVYPVWLRPTELLGAAGLRWEARAGSVGIWIWGLAGASRGPDGGLGVSWTIRAGKLVRRLQGNSTQSADPWAAVAREPRIRRSDP
jgi:hypothetical protein